MKNPEMLREATDKVLFGLTADDSLKQRILQNAASGRNSSSRRFFSPVPAFCAVIAMLLITVGVLNNLRPVDPAASVEMNVFSAGSVDISPSPDSEVSVLPAGFVSENVTSVEMSGYKPVTDPQECAALIAALEESELSAESVDAESAGSVVIHSSDGSSYRFDVCEPYLLSDGQCRRCETFFTLYHEISKE